jgi:hypothetical protein
MNKSSHFEKSHFYEEFANLKRRLSPEIFKRWHLAIFHFVWNEAFTLSCEG